MWKYIVFFILGVLVMLYMNVNSEKKMKGLYSTGYVFINLVIVLLHELINIIIINEIISINSIIVMIIQSIGFLIVLKIANDCFRMSANRMWKKRTQENDIFEDAYNKWRENTFGILVIMTSINNFILGILTGIENYFVQAIFIFIIFIGFFISLKSIVSGKMLKEILPTKAFWSRTFRTVYEDWIKPEVYAIIAIAAFFVMADYFIYSKSSLTLGRQMAEILFSFLAFSFGVLLIGFITKIKKKA